MRTVTFKRVWQGAFRLCQLDPEGETLTPAMLNRMCEFINARVREGWEYDWFPELVTVEERTPASQLIAWEQSGETALGDVWGVTDKNPDTSETFKSWAWVPTAEGIALPESGVGSTVFVKFRRRPNQFSLAEHVVDGTYAAGDIVYRAATGECYEAVLVDGVEDWNRMAFPEFLVGFVTFAAAGDYQTHLGDAEAGGRLRAAGYVDLERQSVRLVKGQGGVIRARFVPVR